MESSGDSCICVICNTRILKSWAFINHGCGQCGGNPFKPSSNNYVHLNWRKSVQILDPQLPCWRCRDKAHSRNCRCRGSGCEICDSNPTCNGCSMCRNVYCSHQST